MAKLIITKDVNGVAAYGLPFTEDNFFMLLDANVVDSVTVPSINEKPLMAVFSYESGSKVWVGLNPSSPIAAPTGAATSTVAQQNPPARNVSAGDIIEFVTSDTTAEVGVSFYELA
jgi:hypothetical protein